MLKWGGRLLIAVVRNSSNQIRHFAMQKDLNTVTLEKTGTYTFSVGVPKNLPVTHTIYSIRERPASGITYVLQIVATEKL